MSGCISYPLLRNKLPRDLVALTTTFIHSQLPWARNPGVALLAFFLKVSCGTVITVSVRAGILSEGSTGKNQLPESLMWLLSGFSSLQVVGLGPQFLTGRGLEATLRSLPSGPLCRAAHIMAAGLLREDRQDGGEHEEDQGHSLCNLIVDEPFYLWGGDD